MLIIYATILTVVSFSGANSDNLTTNGPNTQQKYGVYRPGPMKPRPTYLQEKPQKSFSAHGYKIPHRSTTQDNRIYRTNVPSQSYRYSPQYSPSHEINSGRQQSKSHSGTASYPSSYKPSPASYKSSYTGAPRPAPETEYQSSRVSPHYDNFFKNSNNNHKIQVENTRPAEIKIQDGFYPSSPAFLIEKTPLNDASDFSEINFPIYSSVTQIPPATVQSVSSNAQVPVYKTSYKGLKNSAPGYEKISDSASSIRPSEKVIEDNPYNEAISVNVNGKKMTLPVLQVANNQGLSQYLQAFENQPLLLSPRLQYQAEPTFGFNFGTESAKLTGTSQPIGNSPFLAPASSFQAQVVPIQTGGGTAQFPQYRGASIGVYPTSGNIGRVPTPYESLRAQPQLHFGTEHSVPSADTFSSKPEEILTDVEIIPTKTPPPPVYDDDEGDNGSNDPGKGSESDEDNNPERPKKYFEKIRYENNFKPSFPFKEYDQKFAKYSNQDDSKEEKPASDYKHYPSSEEDEGEEIVSSKYTSGDTSSERQNSYEDDDEDETRQYEKQRKPDVEYGYKVPKHYKDYEKDFEKDFDNSYKKEQPKNKKNKYSSQDEPNDANDAKSRLGSRFRESPKSRFRDNEEYSTSISTKKIPKTIYEESFRSPKSTKHYKNLKQDKDGRDLSAEKSSKDSYFRFRRPYYPLIEPKTFNDSMYEKEDSYSSASNRKLNKSSPEDTFGLDSSIVPGLVRSNDQTSFDRPTLSNAKLRSLTTAEILRDLTGI